ncbi:MAG: hypothetical protein ABFR32_04805 [Bacteroidota bacterium]
MEKDSKNIDKIIQENLDIKNPSLDFTDKVMQQVLTSEVNEEKALTSLLQKHTLETPSLDFTSKVMLGLPQNSSAFVYQPVIGKKTWYFISLIFILLVIYISFNLDTTPKQSEILIPYLIKIKSIFSFNMPDILTSPLFALSMFALSTLLLIDYFIRNRRFS